MTQVHKLEILIIDHDGLGADEVQSVLEETHYPNRCIRPHVLKIQTRQVEWSDEHPLNNVNTFDAAQEELFS
jgi:hypothetical protein